MKLKRIFAGVVAASVASTLAIGAFAETKTIKPNDPGELFYGGLDIYFGEIGSSILDDVTVLNGALSVTINFEVSDFEEYGEEFAVYVYYYQIDWDNVDWDAEDLEFDEGFGDDVVISEDGVYSATLEFNAPLEVDEEFLYLGLWSDDNDGSTPVIEVIDLEVAYEDEPETDAPETDAPETDAPETEAPETEAPETEAPE
ncbi:MAG: hypothetical protein J1E39_06640, partial [Eubacterium sp.]|nr:hypothetical protein [Eubacterium sp.]